MQAENKPPITVKSFVRRQGRMSKSQKEALIALWPCYGLLIEQGPLDYQMVFGQNDKIIVEIGFGMGQSLLAMAKAEPETCFIGIEVHKPGIGALLVAVEQEQINNIRIYEYDAIEILKQVIPDGSVDRLQLFFPDPWPKRRHHKRRLVQADFIDLIASKLKVGGLFHVATDWQNYAEQILKNLQESEKFVNIAGENQYAARPSYRPITKFEKRGQHLGYAVRDIIFQKVEK